MASVEVLEVTQKQYSDMLLKHFLEDILTVLWTLETLKIQIIKKLPWRQVLTNLNIYSCKILGHLKLYKDMVFMLCIITNWRAIWRTMYVIKVAIHLSKGSIITLKILSTYKKPFHNDLNFQKSLQGQYVLKFIPVFLLIYYSDTSTSPWLFPSGPHLQFVLVVMKINLRVYVLLNISTLSWHIVV